MKHTRQYPKRHYRPNLSVLAAYMQPLKVNTESIEQKTGEPIMYQPITKRMSALGKVSRGLDQTHPEYKRKSRQKLGPLLQQAIGQVYQLERDHEGKLITLDLMRDAAFSLLETHQHAKDTQQPIDPEQIYLLAVDMLEKVTGLGVSPLEGGYHERMAQ
ncbi:MAG: hypothetical protein VXW65_02780 [Pseudomonadota bacterium]|nr:hypothetical protein [Pseudomonadota bacterium]